MPKKHWFLLFFISFFACTNDMQEAKDLVNDEDISIENGLGVEMLFTTNGKPKILIKGDSTQRTEHKTKPFTEFFGNFQVFVYKEEREIESTLLADYGKIYDGESEMIAKKNVHVINTNGDQLETEELFWDKQKEIIYSKQQVKIKTTDEIIFGRGLTAQQNFTNYVIDSVTGIIQVESSMFKADEDEVD